MRSRLAVVAALALIALLAQTATGWAQVGVGVNVGKISVDKPLMPGGIYHLPSVGVINTGHEAGDYEVEITYMYQQKELKPPAEWVHLDPKSFPLQPGTSQAVAITLSIPVNARPGDYFALIEAHPIVKKSGVAIGVAAATKLYFSVKPANVVAAISARITSFLETTSPYSYIGLGVVGLAVVIYLFLRYFRLSFRLERKG